MALLSQETGKAAFDGQFQSLDPQNARPPVVTLSDQEADTREITLALDEFGRLTMQFDGVQKLHVLQTDPGTDKPVTTVVGAGSTVEAHLTFTLDAAEYDRLASLDYTHFDDTQANAVMADKNAIQNSPPPARPSPLNSASSPTPSPSASASSPPSTEPDNKKTPGVPSGQNQSRKDARRIIAATEKVFPLFHPMG